MHVQVGVIGAIILEWKEHNFSINQHQSGAPPKIPHKHNKNDKKEGLLKLFKFV